MIGITSTPNAENVNYIWEKIYPYIAFTIIIEKLLKTFQDKEDEVTMEAKWKRQRRMPSRWLASWNRSC